MRFLITGSNGLLGQKLINKLSNNNSIELIATSIGDNRLSKANDYRYINLDITNWLYGDTKYLFREYDYYR